jgi:hypothetical protein
LEKSTPWKIAKIAMKLDLTKPTFVFVGAWNKAILQPSWLIQHLFEIPEGQSVQGTVVGEPTNPEPFWVFDGVGVSAGADRARIYVNNWDAATLTRAEAAVIRLIQKLPYTPLGPWGVNFQLVLSNPEDALLDKLKCRDGLNRLYPIRGESFTSSLQLPDDGTVLLNLGRRPSPQEVWFDLNFHFELPPSPERVAEVIPGIVKRYYQKGIDVLKAIYDIEPSGEVIRFQLDAQQGGD